MEKEEILKQVNDICDTHKFNLVDANKEKFVDKMIERTDFTAENFDNDKFKSDLEFMLESSFHFQSGKLAQEAAEWKKKEQDYLKKINQKPKADVELPKVELSEDVKSALEEIQNFKNEKLATQKRSEVMKESLKKIREDLHDDFKLFFEDEQIDATKDASELANHYTARFQKLFKNKVGDVKPLSSDSRGNSFMDYLDKKRDIKLD